MKQSKPVIFYLIGLATVLMSAVNSPTAWNPRCEVREKLLDFLQKKYPQNLPRMRVELETKK